MVNTKGTFFKKGYKLNDICFDKYTFDLNEYKLKLYNLAVDLTEFSIPAPPNRVKIPPTLPAIKAPVATARALAAGTAIPAPNSPSNSEIDLLPLNALLIV